MTDRNTPSAAEAEDARTSVFGWLIFFPIGILGLFGLNLFVIEPFLNHSVSPVFAQLSYIAIRVIGLVVLAFGLTRYAFRNRFQTISTVLMVGFIDQVFLKGLWVKRDIAANPAGWVGFEPTNSAIFVNMATGYLFFVPIVLILSFLGMEATRFKRDWTHRP